MISKRTQALCPQLRVGSIRTLWIAIVLSFCCASLSNANQISELEITEEKGEYHVRILTVLDAPAERVYQVITDFENSERIYPAVTKSEILRPPDDGSVRLRNYLKYCFVVFCYDLKWVGDIQELPGGYLKVDTVPELSNFESGAALWNVRPFGQRTQVFHETIIKPDFYVPPVIGTLIMKKRIENEIVTTFEQIESEAKSQADKSNSRLNMSGRSSGRPSATPAGLTQRPVSKGMRAD